MSSSSEPEGALVPEGKVINPGTEGSLKTLTRKHVILTPLNHTHAADLYANLGGQENSYLYKYMTSGPYTDLESFSGFITTLSANRTKLNPYAILSRDPVHASNQGEHPSPEGSPVGIICLMNINDAHRTIEIGNVLLARTLQRTTAATEACYLLLRLAFESRYLRVEWKCNDFNEPSKRAALRLGFVYEGTFRKHLVIRGRRRDSAWYSVIDDEWEAGVRQALEQWMDEANLDENKRQRRKLEEIREGLKGKQ